jgi:plastocyanin
VRRAMLGLVAVLGLVVASCAPIPEGAVEAEALECPPGTEGCDPIQPVGPGGSLEVDAGNFWFEVTDGVPITGDIEVTLVNVSDTFHNFEALGAAEGSDIIEANAFEEGTGVVKLFPGAWTIICNVPGHREAGMEFQLTVFADEDEAAAAEEAGELPGQFSQREG